MTLRRRLLLGLGVAFSVFAAGAVLTVILQRDHLFGQVDDQLRATPLPPPAPAGGLRNDGEANPADPPISDLYLATIDLDGNIVVVIEGQRLMDHPDESSLLTIQSEQRSFSNVEGALGAARFRVHYISAQGNGLAHIVAVPVDNVEATINQLIYTFIVVAAVIAALLALVGFWVNRLGVRPITEITATADAIAGGERARRAESYGGRTEAGKLSSAFNVMLDQRDEAEDRLREFVSNASHELRTPLTSIRGYLDLYTDGGFRGPGELDDAVRRMQAESARMNLLVEGLLLLAKLDEQQPLDLATIDVSSMLADIATSARVAHPDRRISVSTSEIDDLAVEADALRLQQAVAGIVDNAITHTPPEADVRLEGLRSNGAVEIIVSDTGPGLSADDTAKVFDRFYRGDPSRARSSGGSGLGLSITKSIIEAHGGEVTLATTPGEGAAFTVRLPLL